MLPDTQHNREQAFEHMYGMPKEWLDELVEDWQEPLMGGLTYAGMSILSDAQECIALVGMTLRGSTSIVLSM